MLSVILTTLFPSLSMAIPIVKTTVFSLSTRSILSVPPESIKEFSSSPLPCSTPGKKASKAVPLTGSLWTLVNHPPLIGGHPASQS